MTKDDISRMAREAGMHDPMIFIGAYERFANLVAAALRAQMEQPEQEPVAWMHTTATGHVYFRKKPQDAVFNPQPLYLQSPSKPDPAADAMRDFNRYGVGVIAPQDKETS